MTAIIIIINVTDIIISDHEQTTRKLTVVAISGDGNVTEAEKILKHKNLTI
jgi:hypothetical protein